MATYTQSDPIRCIEKQGRVNFLRNDVMDLKANIGNTTKLTGKSVSFETEKPELFVVGAAFSGSSSSLVFGNDLSNPTFDALLFELGIDFHPFVDMRPIIVRFVSRLVSHPFYARMISLRESLVPSLTSDSFFAGRIVASDVLRKPLSSTFSFWSVLRNGIKLHSTTALAHTLLCRILFAMVRHCSLLSRPPYTGKCEKATENRVNCWKILRATDATTQPETVNVNAKKTVDWTISSQAMTGEGVMEGSTARSVTPKNNPIQERPTPKGDDIAWTAWKHAEA